MPSSDDEAMSHVALSVAARVSSSGCNGGSAPHLVFRLRPERTIMKETSMEDKKDE
jgi:hypothetical protein